MSNLHPTDLAIAIRMTASRPDVARAAGPAPVVVSESHAPCAPAGQVCDLGECPTPQEAARKLAEAVRVAGHLPECVKAEAGFFRVHPWRGGPKRLPHCVTIITGSAQGFGRGIAEELTRQGARVVVADINDPVGNAFAHELNQQHGEGTAIYCHTDVTSLASFEACVLAAVKAFGGVDMLLSNAGVLKAGSLEEMDEKGFDLVTHVNYKAYFLGVKAVTRVMKLQHELNPGHVMDIIQINSKSGLEGSDKNFAYAGSKFGGIGLTQSFAKELVPFRIKVNSICPGNYFEGPLWSDPERGLFVQYLRAGKVPGAKTLDDVRAFYMAKVPMNRGCWPSDVATAIFYLHDQQYETGQALPVTGGQVMLS
jgi:NAD(P)-dependent dehydrogenase (short-subunit alcohol dehydrogenase family)